MTRIRLDCDELCGTGALVRNAAATAGDTALDVTAVARACGAGPSMQTWIEREAAAVRAELTAIAGEYDTTATDLMQRGGAVSAESTLPAVANRNPGLVTVTDPNDPNIILAWDPDNPGVVMAWNRNNPNFVIAWNRDNPDLVVGMDQRDPTRMVGFSQGTGNAVLLVQHGGVWTPTVTNFTPTPTVGVGNALVGGSSNADGFVVHGPSPTGGPMTIGGTWGPDGIIEIGLGPVGGTMTIGGVWSSSDPIFVPGPSLPSGPSTGGAGVDASDPFIQAQMRGQLQGIWNSQAATNFNTMNLGSGLHAHSEPGGVGIYNSDGTRHSSL
jgi:hypothetical protein